MDTESSARSWRGAVISLALIGIAALGAVLTREYRDRSRSDPIYAMLRIEPDSPLFAHDAVYSAGGMAQACKIQGEMIRSHGVLADLATHLKSAHPDLLPKKGDPIAWLREAIHVEAVPDTPILKVTMPGAPFEYQASSINALIDAYFRLFRDWESSIYDQRIAMAEQAYDQYRVELVNKRQELRDGQARNAPPEQLDQLRDEVAIREAVSLKLGIALEERRLDRKSTGSVRFVMPAKDPKGEGTGIK